MVDLFAKFATMASDGFLFRQKIIIRFQKLVMSHGGLGVSVQFEFHTDLHITFLSVSLCEPN